MIAAAVSDFRVIVVLAFVVLVALVLGYRLMNRDLSVQRTRYGFFVERDRFDEDADDETTRRWPTKEDS